MSDTTCNGWTNYETWQAALWLNEADYLGCLQEDEVRLISGDDVYAYVEEILFEKRPEGLLGDIVIGWTFSVNWEEIADNFNKDLECEQ